MEDLLGRRSIFDLSQEEICKLLSSDEGMRALSEEVEIDLKNRRRVIDSLEEEQAIIEEELQRMEEEKKKITERLASKKQLIRDTQHNDLNAYRNILNGYSHRRFSGLEDIFIKMKNNWNYVITEFMKRNFTNPDKIVKIEFTDEQILFYHMGEKEWEELYPVDMYYFELWMEKVIELCEILEAEKGIVKELSKGTVSDLNNIF